MVSLSEIARSTEIQCDVFIVAILLFAVGN